MTAPHSSRSGHRLRLPALIVVITAAAVFGLRLIPELERNIRYWAAWGIPALGCIALLLWFLFLSRYSMRARLIGLALTLALGGGLKLALRVDGTADGTGLPRLAWRWTPKPQRAAPVAAASDAPLVEAPGAKDVPDFFGPQRDGIVRGANLLPNWKSQPPRELWRQPVGAGWSAFAVVGGRALTQEQREEDEAVTCYEMKTGRLLWIHTHKARFEEWQGGPGPRATPVVRGGRVYAMGATGILDCLDLASGRELWSVPVLEEYGRGNITWGISASPLVYEDTVVVTGGAAPGPTLIAFRASTGEPLWQSGSDGASYVSPSLVTLLDRHVVLSLSEKVLSAHDPETGAEQWRYSWAAAIPAKGSQPVVTADNRIFLSAGYHAGCILLKVEPGPDGKPVVSKLWENRKMKTQFNSVALREGHLYGLDDGKLACVEIETGERLWKEGRFGSGQSLMVDDLVIVQAETGGVTLCSATPAAYQELGRVPALDSKTWNHPVLAGRYLLLRNDHEAVCYEVPLKTP